MGLKKVTLTSAIALLSIGLAGCSSSTTSKPKNISFSQLSSNKSRKKVINNDLAKNLKKEQKKAKDGNEDYNYSLYVYKIQTWQDQTIAVNVDRANYLELSTKEKIAVGQSINDLVKKVFKENYVKAKSSFFISIYDEDGNVLIPAYNYQTFKFKYKQDQEEADKPDIPTEYENALVKAQSYSDNMFMSKQKIYHQLTSQYGEGFSKKAAKYAIDHVKADWNKNALKKAESYQKDQHLSKERIRHQLTSAYGEQFTEAQADYAISHLAE
ncbi:hypothetical protein GCM10022297_01470 [Lactobacillus hamsteri]|nr:Ltp family lipoprotein [Lactobacillus hamsteri]